jgi:hypothetical protein
MLTVDLKSLGKRAGPAIRYLGSNVNESLRVKGPRVQLASTKARTTKQLLHKFLHQNGLETYRVVITRPDLVEVLKPKGEKRQLPLDNVNMFQNNETIPYYQVAAEWGVVPKPGRRVKWRP